MVHWPSSCASEALARGAGPCCGAPRAATLPRRSAVVGSRMPQTTSPSHPRGRSAIMACRRGGLGHFGTHERRRRKLSGLLDPPLALVELHPEQQAVAAADLACPAQHIDAPLAGETGQLAGPHAMRTLGGAQVAMALNDFRPLAVPTDARGSWHPLVEGMGL